MKRKFLIFFAFIFIVSFPAFSQTAVTDSIDRIANTDSIIGIQSPSGKLSGLIDIQDLANDGYNYWGEEFEGHWSGVEFGVNGFGYSDYSLYPAQENNFLANDLIRSNVLNLNLFQYSKGLQQNRNTIGLVTGVGLSIQSYRLNNSTTLKIDENRKIYPETLFFDSNQKSKLSSVYLDVPLLVEIQIPVGHVANRIYVSLGVTGSKRLETHTKVKYRKNDKREKLKSPGDYSIGEYKIAGTIRVGYRWINLFSNYDMVPLFDERKGPVLYPFSFGIKLISF